MICCFQENIFSAPARPTDINEIFADIKNGVYSLHVQELRAEDCKERARELKSSLPALVPSVAQFKDDRAKSANALKHSGLVCIDIDKIPDPSALKERLKADPYIYAAFISPSGNGLKVLLKVPPGIENHPHAYASAAAHIRRRYNVEPDRTHDISRRCFVSFDPELYLNENALEVPCKDLGKAEEVERELQKIKTPLDYDTWLDVLSAVFNEVPDKETAISLLKKYIPEKKAGEYEQKYGKHLTDKRFGTLKWIASGKRRDSRERPRLLLPSGDDPYISPCASKLFKIIAPSQSLFIRGGQVVEHNGDSFSIISPDAFCSKIEKFCDPYVRVAYSNGGLVERNKSVPTELAKKLLSAEERFLLPEVSNISRGPIARIVDGKLEALSDGLHDSTLVCSSVRLQEMSLEEAKAIILEELLGEFDFGSPADKSRAVGALLSPLLKSGNIIKAATYPLHFVEANASQTGKDYLCECIAAIYGETPYMIARTNGGVGSFDENLQQALFNGKPFVVFGNVRGEIKSEYFEMLLTAQSKVNCRLPHRAAVELDPRPFSFFMTSNGAELNEDMGNRQNHIRLRKREKFIYREYEEGSLLEHIQGNRSKFISALFCVAREYVARGCPRTNDLRAQGRFLRWFQSIDWICQNILGMESALDGYEEVRERITCPGLSFLRAIANTLTEEARFSAEGLLELALENDIPIRGKPATYTKSSSLGHLFKKVFAKRESVTIDDWTITRKEDTDKTPNGTLKPTKFYYFTYENRKNTGKTER